MLTAAAVGAATGVYRVPCQAILGCIKSIQTTTRQSRWMMVLLAILLGGLLGVFLTFGFHFGLFTVSGMLIAIGIMVGLVERVDYLVKYKRL